MLKCISLTENYYILFKISLQFDPKGPIYFESALI